MCRKIYDNKTIRARSQKISGHFKLRNRFLHRNGRNRILYCDFYIISENICSHGLRLKTIFRQKFFLPTVFSRIKNCGHFSRKIRCVSNCPICFYIDTSIWTKESDHLNPEIISFRFKPISGFKMLGDFVVSVRILISVRKRKRQRIFIADTLL